MDQNSDWMLKWVIKWPAFKWLNDREVSKMILYRWKHRGRSSLYKYRALNTVHFTIFHDVKSPYHALETIFTVYPTANRNGLISAKFWVKTGLFPPWIQKRIGDYFAALKMDCPCGPSGCVAHRYGPTSKRTTRDGTGFQQVFHGFISMWSYPGINVKLKWYFLIEKLNRQKVINHNYFPMTEK